MQMTFEIILYVVINYKKFNGKKHTWSDNKNDIEQECTLFVQYVVFMSGKGNGHGGVTWVYDHIRQEWLTVGRWSKV